MGPGNPYCRIPCGLTGDTKVEGVVGVAGMLGYDGEGGGGTVGVEGNGAVVVGGSLDSLGREKTIALNDAPAAAEAAATIASVVLDMTLRIRRPYGR